MTFFTEPRRCLQASLASVKRARRFDDDLRADRVPIQFRRILSREDLDLFPGNRDGIGIAGDFLVQRSEHGIVFQQVSQRLCIGEIVHRHEFHVIPVQTRADDVPANAAEAINANFYSHLFLLLFGGIELTQRISGCRNRGNVPHWVRPLPDPARYAPNDRIRRPGVEYFHAFSALLRWHLKCNQFHFRDWRTDELRSIPDACDLGSHAGLRPGVRSLPRFRSIGAEPCRTHHRTGLPAAGRNPLFRRAPYGLHRRRPARNGRTFMICCATR